MTAKGIDLVTDCLVSHGFKNHGMGMVPQGVCSLKIIWASSYSRVLFCGLYRIKVS
ncbi:MAG: hypothetical protein RBQ72_05565 [Desulfobacterium sp.]|nr:hypothetical protein [Desulfobacterium sp.]